MGCENKEAKMHKENLARIIDKVSKISVPEAEVNVKEDIGFLDYKVIDDIFNQIDNVGVIEDIKDILAKRFFITKEDLIDEYFAQNISSEIWNQKYRLYDQVFDQEKGEYVNVPLDKTPFHTIIRVSYTLALSYLYSLNNSPTKNKEEASKLNEVFAKFFAVMALNYGFGAGRIMANAGALKYKRSTTLINCTVMKQIPDSIEGIMEVAKEAALTLKSGAGVGYDFSSIRPVGSLVRGAGAGTSGLLSFMEIFDRVCSVIMSAGGRRGAQMAVIDYRHPEVVDVFQAKRKDGTLRYFNISVGIDGKFFEAIKNDETIEQWFWEPDGSLEIKEVLSEKDEVVLSNGEVAKIIRKNFSPYNFDSYKYFVFDKDHSEYEHSKKDKHFTEFTEVFRKRVFRTIKAKDLYDTIMQSTYDYAEPGVLFLDKINEGNPLNNEDRKNNGFYVENIRATNPCGEQPLPFYGSCNLGSVFIHSFVIEPFSEKDPYENYDFEALYKVARIMNLMLDAVNNITNLPLEELRKQAEFTRRHGLGITGLADMLAMLGLKYSSEEGRKFVEKVMQVIAEASLDENVYLAKILGPAPAKVRVKDWYLSRHYSFLKEKKNYDENELLRYSHATSVAPTGTMSLSWGNNISNGIEPIFSYYYVRNIRVPGKLTKVSEEVLNFTIFLIKKKFKVEIEEAEKIAKEMGIETTNDLRVEDHIYMQAVVQDYVDSAVSKTCNIPTDYPFEDFKKAYMLAYDLGLKGFTTFRFNPKFGVGVIVKKDDLEKTKIKFVTDLGEEIIVKASDEIIYDGEKHLAGNLYEALKEGIYGKM